MVFSRPEEGIEIGLEKDDDILRPDPYLNHKKILVPEPLFSYPPLLCRAHVVRTYYTRKRARTLAHCETS